MEHPGHVLSAVQLNKYYSACGAALGSTNSFRKGLRGASAAARVACASGVDIANAYAARTQIGENRGSWLSRVLLALTH